MNKGIAALAAATPPHDMAVATLAVCGAVVIIGAACYLFGTAVIGISERWRRRAAERAKLDVAKPATQAEIRDMVGQLRAAADELEARLENDGRTDGAPGVGA